MIANERQHRITAAQIRRFENAIKRAREDGPRDGVEPRVHEAMIEGMRSQLADLRREMRRYEALRNGEITSHTFDSLADLPVALIEGRIACRFTQKQLADKLKVPEQQIQRYEQTRYQGASIERLQEIADAINITLRKTVRYHTPAASSSRARPAAAKRKAASARGKATGKGTARAAVASKHSRSSERSRGVASGQSS